MIDFNALSKADDYVRKNINETFKTHVRTTDMEGWTERDKEIYKLGLSDGMRHGYYNANIEKEGDVNEKINN